MVKVSVDLEVFDFDFWTRNKVRVINILLNVRFIDSVGELASIMGLSYSSVRAIVIELQNYGVIESKGRGLVLASDWEKKFIFVGA